MPEKTWLDVLEGALVTLSHESPEAYTSEIVQVHKIVLTAQARPAKLKMLLLPVFETRERPSP